MKKIGKYLIITLLLLLGLCCVGVLYLFFIPNSSLFNISYVSHHTQISSQKEYFADDVNKIVLNSSKFEVKIVESYDDNISLKVYDQAFGFALVKNNSTTINEDLNSAGVLTFNVKETSGAVLKNSSAIELKIPKNKEFDISLKNKKATTSIDGENIKINALSYETEKGDFEFKKGNILGKISLNLNDAKCNISSEVQTNLNDVELKIKKGRFTASETNFGDVQILSNDRGVITLGSCLGVYQDLGQAGGKIKVKSANQITITSSDTNIVADTVGGAIITLTATGNVEIGEVTAFSTIKTNDGHITIQNANYKIELTSEDGNISVNNAKCTVKAKTEYGNIFVNFDQSVPEVSSRALLCEMNNGKLTTFGALHIQTTVTGDGRVEAYLSGVENLDNVNSFIKGKNGSVYVTIPNECVYTLTTKSDNGNVRVNLTQIPNYGGYTNRETILTNVNCDSAVGQNRLIVSTSYGDLTILDSNFD